MPTYRRCRAGRVAQQAGGQFEIMLSSRASSVGIECIRIPDGCRMVRGSRGYTLRRVATPFDYVFLYKNKTILLDAKTVDGNTFPYSAIVAHQLKSLRRCERHAHLAGYMVWHRDVDALVFYTASILHKLKPRESLNPTLGHHLGSLHTANIARLFSEISTRPIDSLPTHADIIDYG
jgi:penicillin-binding protein-related factor A (putative recombinase)